MSDSANKDGEALNFCINKYSTILPSPGSYAYTNITREKSKIFLQYIYKQKSLQKLLLLILVSVSVFTKKLTTAATTQIKLIKANLLLWKVKTAP